MLDGVKELWPKFTESFEGRTNYLYQDSKHFMTTGLGVNLDGPVPSPTATPTALRLAWENPARPASRRFSMKFDRPGALCARAGARRRRARQSQEMPFACPLKPFAICSGTKRKKSNRSFRSAFPAIPHGQRTVSLGFFRWAGRWAHIFHFPLFEESVNRMTPDFEKAARESEIIGSPRNAANRTLFENAAHVFTHDLPFASLAFPEMAKKGIARASQPFRQRRPFLSRSRPARPSSRSLPR